MEQASDNPLVSDKPSDSGTTVSLHPLVLLTASDQITRHRVRGESQPVVGVLLGQQKGREITVEHAFAAALVTSEDGKYNFKQDWLDQRTQQYRDVHKAPALDIVGWFALVPTSGPLPELVPFQRYMASLNETNVLLAIHPTAFERSDAADQKLPVTVYESTVDSAPTKDDNSMQVDGEESSNLKFRPVPYSIETDEAEMIAINFVSKGAGSAAAVADSQASQPANSSTANPQVEDRKGKKRASPEASQPKSQAPTDLEVLSSEEQDQIANLTTRLNSVKMLQSRLAQLQAFASSIPPSYLSDASTPLTPESPNPDHLSHLRNIQALLTRLSLLSPSPTSGAAETDLEAAGRAQRNDVNLTQLLSTLSKDVQGLQELGKTFSIVDQARQSKRKPGNSGFDPGSLSSMTTDFRGPGGHSMLV